MLYSVIIAFSGIPSEEVRTELKNEGWLYSRNHNVWYPRNIAAENSMEFAKHIKEAYFPEPHEEVKIITEASEKDELAFMIQSGSTLKEILAKLSDMYGENAVNEAFKEAGNLDGIGMQSHLDTNVSPARFTFAAQKYADELHVVIHITELDIVQPDAGNPEKIQGLYYKRFFDALVAAKKNGTPIER